MTSLTIVVAGSVEASITIASNAQSIDAHEDSVRTVKVTVTDPHSVSSRDSPYQHHASAPPQRHLRIPLPH